MSGDGYLDILLLSPQTVAGKIVKRLHLNRDINPPEATAISARNPGQVSPLSEDFRKNLLDSNWRIRLGALTEIECILGRGDTRTRHAACSILKQRAEQERNRQVHKKIESLLASFDGNAESRTERKNSKTFRKKPRKKPAKKLVKVFREILKDRSKGPEMVVVPAGEFLMGDLLDSGRDNEKPVRKVTIGKPFALGRYPVTFAEYDRFCKRKSIEKPDDGSWGRARRPVINVSWEDAVAYAKWLSSETGKSYRLPSEAEWEYAARADTQTDYWWGNETSPKYANYSGSGGQTTPVDRYPPNAYGLYDLSGNVREWVEDCYDGSYQNKPVDGSAWTLWSCKARMVRGGSWFDDPKALRSAYRLKLEPLRRSSVVGFRLAQDL